MVGNYAEVSMAYTTIDRLEIKISIGSESMLILIVDPSSEKKIDVHLIGEKVDAKYIQFLTVLIESAKALMSGLEINRFFCPVPETKRTEILFNEGQYPKFKWTKRGLLRFCGMTRKKFMHAETVEVALSRRGVFTCSNTISQLIPLRKVSNEENNS